MTHRQLVSFQLTVSESTRTKQSILSQTTPRRNQKKTRKSSRRAGIIPTLTIILIAVYQILMETTTPLARKKVSANKKTTSWRKSLKGEALAKTNSKVTSLTMMNFLITKIFQKETMTTSPRKRRRNSRKRLINHRKSLMAGKTIHKMINKMMPMRKRRMNMVFRAMKQTRRSCRDSWMSGMSRVPNQASQSKSSIVLKPPNLARHNLIRVMLCCRRIKV